MSGQCPTCSAKIVLWKITQYCDFPFQIFLIGLGFPFLFFTTENIARKHRFNICMSKYSWFVTLMVALSRYINITKYAFVCCGKGISSYRTLYLFNGAIKGAIHTVNT